MAIDFVLLAAGKGTRLWPVTASTPKAMVRILGRPIIEWIAEAIADKAGKIVVVVGGDGDVIKKHFQDRPYFSKMVFALQEEQKGTGHAVLCASQFVGGNFAVLNADTFADPDFYEMVCREAEKGGSFLVANKVDDVSSYGVVVEEGGMLKEIQEKAGGEAPGLISTGCYFVGKSFFSELEKLTPSERGEIEATGALTEHARKSGVKILEYEGYWNDVGYYWNYLDSSRRALDSMKQTEVLGKVEQGVFVKGNIFVGKNSVLKSGTYVEGPVYVGDGCTVGPNAYLREGTVLEGDNHVGNASEIKNSVIGRGSNVPHLSYVADSIICEDVNLGAGTIVANLKFDETPVTPEIKGEKVSSKKRKLGCVVGRGTKTGINVSINCGVLIGENCRILPDAVVMKNLESGTSFSSNGNGNK